MAARHGELTPVIQLLRRWRSGGSQFEASKRRSLRDPPPISTNKKLGVVAGICHASYGGSIYSRIIVQACPGIEARPYLKNSERKRGWGYGSSGRVPARQAKGSEFKLWY
jgi:hypothetical protein